ncbi:MAG: hypothetical protein B6I28_05035 [Fusobacteriia bacterium 4572_132]|nr:MAG: hypothetical protein B6I28_05035 [Fusobacteriia bacterium 4572_132]
MKKIMGLIFLSMMVLIYSEENMDVSFGIGRDYYIWKEFGKDDRVLLTEKGPLKVMNMMLSYKKNDKWNILEENSYGYEVKLINSFYDGRINYEGEDQEKNKFYTQTDIMGFSSEVGYEKAMLEIEDSSVSLFFYVGIGLEKWTRLINSGNSSIEGYPSVNSTINGYYEKYTQGLGKVALIIKTLNEDKPNYIFEFGTAYPFYTEEIVEFKKLGYLDDLKINPGKEFSPFLKMSFSPKKEFKMDLYTNLKLLDLSNRGSISYYGEYGNKNEAIFIQPKSMQIRMGVNFEYGI